MAESVDVLFSMPGLRAARWTTADLFAGIEHDHAVRPRSMRPSAWWGSGKTWESGVLGKQGQG